MQTYNVDGLFQHLTGVKAQRDKDVPLTAWLIHDNAVIGLARAVLDLALHSAAGGAVKYQILGLLDI